MTQLQKSVCILCGLIVVACGMIGAEEGHLFGGIGGGLLCSSVILLIISPIVFDNRG